MTAIPTMADVFLAEAKALMREQEAIIKLHNRALKEGREEVAAFLLERIRAITDEVYICHFEVLMLATPARKEAAI